jgi:hypothetical protein
MTGRPRPVRVGVLAPPPVRAKLIYALEELLMAAGVTHVVCPTESPSGWDLFYGDRPPDDGAPWMAASPDAWRFLSRPGCRVEQARTLTFTGVTLRLPIWGADEVPFSATKTSPLPDLAAAAFFFLSRWEEWQAPEHDRFGRFPLAASVFGRGLWSLLDCPVESYARALRRVLEATPRTAWLAYQSPSTARSRGDIPMAANPGGASAGGRNLLRSPTQDTETRPDDCSAAPLGIGEGHGFVLGVSHDIDSIRRWDARGFARTSRSAFRALLAGRADTVAAGGTELMRGVRVRLAGRDPHDNLEETLTREEAMGVRGSFFLLSRHTHPWDGTHSAHYRRRLPSLARALASAAEVGLHASTAATSCAALRAEREQMEALTGVPVRGVRYHNLRGGYSALPDVTAAGFEYDSSIAFAECPGFAAGLARPFRPYDRERDRPLKLLEIPLAVMDTTLLSPRYLGLAVEDGRKLALEVLEVVRRWEGAAAVLWHNDNLPPNTAGGYDTLFPEIVEQARECRGSVAPLGEIAGAWQRIRKALGRE